MEILNFKNLLISFVAYITFVQLRHWYRWTNLHRWAQQFNCGDAKSLPNRLPWGVDKFAMAIFGLFTGKYADVDILEVLIAARYKELGVNTFRVWTLFNKTLLETAEPANIQAVLATQFTDFDLGPFRKDNFFDLLGSGIFTAERNEWPRFRHQLRPQFTRGQLSDIERAEHHIDLTFKTFPEEDPQGWIQDIDLMPYLYRYVMDTSTEFLFGKSVDSQTKFLQSADSSNKTEEKGDLDFVSAMDYCQDYIMWRIRLGSFYWMARSKDFQNACKVVKSYADNFVNRALSPEYKQAMVSENRNKFVFLDELVKETQDPDELRDQVLHLLLAGRDTTSAVLSWTLLLLSRHPKEFESLRNTIISTFGTASAPLAPLNFESLKGCKPITYAIYETLRLYPVLPLNGRMAMKDTTLPVGGGPDGKSPIAVKKGEQVSYSAYVIHRREDLWGSDATQWRPERWIDRKLGWEFIGFSGGPRICLGQQYALTEAAFVLVKVLQRYDRIEALDKTKPLRKGLSIILKPRDGVKVKMHRASE